MDTDMFPPTQKMKTHEWKRDGRPMGGKIRPSKKNTPSITKKARAKLNSETRVKIKPKTAAGHDKKVGLAEFNQIMRSLNGTPIQKSSGPYTAKKAEV